MEKKLIINLIINKYSKILLDCRALTERGNGYINGHKTISIKESHKKVG